VFKIKSIRKFTDEDFQEILFKGGVYLLFQVGGSLASYLFTYFVAKEYGAEVNGLLTISFTVILLVSVIGRFGTDLNIIRFYANSKNRDNQGVFLKTLMVVFLFSSFLALIVFYFKDQLSFNIFKMPNLEGYFFWIALTIPLWSLIINFGGFFRAQKKNTLYAFFNNPGRFILSLTIFLLLIFNYQKGNLLPIKAHFYGILVLFIICIFFYASYLSRPSIQFKGRVNNFIRDSLPMMVSETISLFLIFIDTIILGLFENEETVGIYNVSFKIAALTVFTLQAFNSILAPKIAKSFSEENYADAQKMIKLSTNFNFYITLSIVFVIFIFNKQLLFIFGEEFVSGYTVLLILSIGQLINSLSGSVGVILQMSGHQKVYRNLIIFALAINFILNLILTPIYGAIGTATATVVSLSLWNILGALYIKKRLGIISYFTLNFIKNEN